MFLPFHSSDVENALIVDLGHLARGSRRDGMLIILFVIHVTNSETRVWHAPFVAVHTVTRRKKR